MVFEYTRGNRGLNARRFAGKKAKLTNHRAIRQMSLRLFTLVTVLFLLFTASHRHIPDFYTSSSRKLPHDILYRDHNNHSTALLL